MILHHRDFGGTGRPLVILHGLFGSSKNWFSVGRGLTDLAHVVALDLRNHGDSPHDPGMALSDLVQDLGDSLTALQLRRPLLLGHSLGGLTTAAYALRHPQQVHGLIVVDIAPRPYRFRHQQELAALQIDLSSLHNRDEIDAVMSEWVADAGVRQFLQMNVGRSAEGFYWKINTRALMSADITAEAALLSGTYSGPALFVAGGASPYITAGDPSRIKRFFPQSRLVTLPGADHWLHYTEEARFVETVRRWLDQPGA